MQDLKVSENGEAVPSDNDSTPKSHEGSRTPKSKKSKVSKKDRLDPARFQGDGVSFKAKLIGVEELGEARGDKLCQETITRLKAAVKSTGTHKQRIWFSISLEGIKIREDRSLLEPLYHHSVPQISFISQDTTDDRAFGYICSPIPDTFHFVAIKTEKAASQVVLTLRDLFQTVLDIKQKQGKIEHVEAKEEVTSQDMPDGGLDTASESPIDIQESSAEPIYSSIDSQENKEESVSVPECEIDEPASALVDLLDLQFEPNVQHLEENIAQMTLSLTSSSFQSSPMLVPQTNGLAHSPKEEVQEEAEVVESIAVEEKPPQRLVDRYAVFGDLDSEPSIFEKPLFFTSTVDVEQSSDLHLNGDDKEERNGNSSPLPPILNQSSQKPVDFSLFADLDPLGKGKPYVDRKDFFHDIKNPPKKVLKDLVGSSFDASCNGVSICKVQSQNSVEVPPRIPPRANVFCSSSLPPSTPPPVLPMTSRCSDPMFSVSPSPPPHVSCSVTSVESPPRRASPLAKEDSPLIMRRSPRLTPEGDPNSPGIVGTFDSSNTSSPIHLSSPSFVFPNKQVVIERPKNPFANFDEVFLKVNTYNPFMQAVDRLLPPPPMSSTMCDTTSTNASSDVFGSSDVFNVSPPYYVSTPPNDLISPEEGSIFRRKQDPFADDFFQAFEKK